MEITNVKNQSSTGTNTQHPLISAFFCNDQYSDVAMRKLNTLGYSKKDILILEHKDLPNEPCHLSAAKEDSDSELIKKAITGIRKGVLIGIGCVALILALLFLTDSYLIKSGSISYHILLCVVGAVWGGVIGFLLKPLMESEQYVEYDLKPVDGNVLLSFTPKNQHDLSYFSKHWQTVVDPNLSLRHGIAS